MWCATNEVLTQESEQNLVKILSNHAVSSFKTVKQRCWLIQNYYWKTKLMLQKLNWQVLLVFMDKHRNLEQSEHCKVCTTLCKKSSALTNLLQQLLSYSNTAKAQFLWNKSLLFNYYNLIITWCQSKRRNENRIWWGLCMGSPYEFRMGCKCNWKTIPVLNKEAHKRHRSAPTRAHWVTWVSYPKPAPQRVTRQNEEFKDCHQNKCGVWKHQSWETPTWVLAWEV